MTQPLQFLSSGWPKTQMDDDPQKSAGIIPWFRWLKHTETTKQMRIALQENHRFSPSNVWGGTVNVPIQEQFWEDMNHQDKTHAIPITLMVLTNPNGLYYHLKEYGNGYGSKLWSPQSGCFKPVGRPKLLRMTRLKRRCFGTALTPSDSNVKLLNHPATSVPESFKNSPEIWLLKLS